MAADQNVKSVSAVLNETVGSFTEVERSLGVVTVGSDRFLRLLVDSREHDLSLENAANAFQDSLEYIQNCLLDVEKSVNGIPATAISSLGTAAFFHSLPPSNSTKQENGGPGEDGSKYKNLYEDLLSGYASHERYREYSVTAFNAISVQSFRKSSQLLGSRAEKRSLVMSDNVRKWLEQFLRTIQMPSLTLAVHYLPTVGTVVEAVIDRSFRAVIVVRGITIEAINIRGSEENFHLEPKSLRPLDLWTPSELEVYRILTHNASSALMHFQNPLSPELTLRSYLQWLNSLATLFSMPCRKCGKYLDRGMPPTWRDYKRLEPYHESCRIASFT